MIDVVWATALALLAVGRNLGMPAVVGELAAAALLGIVLGWRIADLLDRRNPETRP